MLDGKFLRNSSESSIKSVRLLGRQQETGTRNASSENEHAPAYEWSLRKDRIKNEYIRGNL